MPLRADGFKRALRKANLEHQYPALASGIHSGFLAGLRAITRIYSPPNSASIHDDPAIFQTLIDTEFAAGRWLRPFTTPELCTLIGPFQLLPCSLVNKPVDLEHLDAPQKKCLIQNFSHPFTHQARIESVNSSIAIEDFPCTWGTPEATGHLIWSLPPGSEIAI
jgi:hypothetical protein